MTRKTGLLGWMAAATVGTALVVGALATTAQADPVPALQVALTQVDGTAAFTSDDLPGHDSSADNGIVRTNDTLTYQVTVTTGDVATTGTTIHLALPRGVESSALPSWCAPASSSLSPETLLTPTPPITDTTWHGLSAQTLVCDLGTITAHSVTTYSFPTTVRPEVPHGEELSATVQIRDAVGHSAAAGPVFVTVSARVQLDLTTWGMGTSNATALRAQSNSSCPWDRSKACSYIVLRMLVTSPNGTKGVSPISDSLGITIDLSPTSLWGSNASKVPDWSASAKSTYGARYSSCALTNGVGTLPDGSTTVSAVSSTTNAVRNSGTVSCSQSEPGALVTMTLDNPDTTLWTSPTRSRAPDQPLIDLTRGYVAAVSMYVWVPYETVALLGSTSGSSTALSTSVTASLGSVSDIGGNTNISETVPNDTNIHTVSFSTVSGWDGFISGAPWNPGVTPAATYKSSWQTHQGPVGSTQVRVGDGTVAPGEQVLATTYIVDQMPLGAPGAGRVVCASWDPNQFNLARSSAAKNTGTTWPSGFISGVRATASPSGNAAWLTYLNASNQAGTDVTIEYAHKPTVGNGAASKCDDTTTWYSDPDSVPGNDPTLAAQGIYTSVNAVRTYAYIVPDATASQFAWFAVNLQARGTTLDGGSLLGQYLPVRFSSAGTVATAVGSSAGATLTDVLAAPWSLTATNFTPGTGRPTSTGDWVRVSDGRTTLTARSYNPATNIWGSTPTLAAGDNARFRLSPFYTSSVSGTTPRMITVAACLPVGVRYASASPAAASVRTGESCAANQQLVTWNLGAYTPNSTLPEITLDTTVTTAASNGTATLTGVVSVDYDWTSVAQRTAATNLQINTPSTVSLTVTATEPVVDVTQRRQRQPGPSVGKSRHGTAEPHYQGSI